MGTAVGTPDAADDGDLNLEWFEFPAKEGPERESSRERGAFEGRERDDREDRDRAVARIRGAGATGFSGVTGKNCEGGDRGEVTEDSLPDPSGVDPNEE